MELYLDSEFKKFFHVFEEAEWSGNLAAFRVKMQTNTPFRPFSAEYKFFWALANMRDNPLQAQRAFKEIESQLEHFYNVLRQMHYSHYVDKIKKIYNGEFQTRSNTYTPPPNQAHSRTQGSSSAYSQATKNRQEEKAQTPKPKRTVKPKPTTPFYDVKQALWELAAALCLCILWLILFKDLFPLL